MRSSQQLTLIPVRAVRSCEALGVDLLRIGTTPSADYEYITLKGDKASKFPFVRSIRSKRAERVARHFVSMINFMYPSHRTIDGGGEFNCDVITSWVVTSGHTIQSGEPSSESGECRTSRRVDARYTCGTACMCMYVWSSHIAEYGSTG